VLRGLGPLALLACAVAAGAHVVGTKTLQGLVAEADLVLRARIVAPSEGEGGSRAEPTGGRAPVEAEVLEVLKGALAEPRVRFVQHGHGVAPFAPGEETLLFLLDIARSRELDALGRAGEYAWVSLQEHDDSYPLAPATRDVALAAVRDYASAPNAPTPAARLAALRRATVGLLASRDARLAASALRDLVLAPSLPLVAASDLAVLGPVLDDPDASMGVRVGLLAELERRGLVDGPPRWLRLLSAEAPTPDRVTAIRGAAASRDPRVRSRLAGLLSDPDARVAAAAASALGVQGDPAAVEPLARALSHASSTVRVAAIRGLGGIASPEAARALERAAREHPDPATRRRAAAELKQGGAGAEAARARP